MSFRDDAAPLSCLYTRVLGTSVPPRKTFVRSMYLNFFRGLFIVSRDVHFEMGNFPRKAICNCLSSERVGIMGYA